MSESLCEVISTLLIAIAALVIVTIFAYFSRLAHHTPRYYQSA